MSGTPPGPRASGGWSAAIATWLLPAVSTSLLLWALSHIRNGVVDSSASVWGRFLVAASVVVVLTMLLVAGRRRLDTVAAAHTMASVLTACLASVVAWAMLLGGAGRVATVLPWAAGLPLLAVRGIGRAIGLGLLASGMVLVCLLVGSWILVR